MCWLQFCCFTLSGKLSLNDKAITVGARCPLFPMRMTTIQMLRDKRKPPRLDQDCQKAKANVIQNGEILDSLLLKVGIKMSSSHCFQLKIGALAISSLSCKGRRQIPVVICG